MKLTISLSSRSYPDDDLTTLRSRSPDANYGNFDTNDNMHYDAARHLNPDGQAKLKAKKTISGYKKKKKKTLSAYKKQQQKLKLEIEKQSVPKTNPAVVDRATSSSAGTVIVIKGKLK